MAAATVAAPAGSINFGFKQSNVGLTAYPLSHAWVTAETDDVNDTVEFGYLPAGITVIGLLNVCADLDSGTGTLRHTIKLGATSIVTTDDLCAAGGGEAHFFAPIALTAPTLVSVVTTTAANVHANGTQYLTFLYHATST